MVTKLLASVSIAVTLIAPATTLGQATRKQRHEYYVALGDSLAVGSQPNAQGKTAPTDKGYTNDLYGAEKRTFKGLSLIKLGCPGETTTTMIKGGKCKYPAGSQLGAAVRFLDAHKGHIAFVSIDVGADDFHACWRPTGINQQCFNTADAALRANLPKIARQLRKAAGKRVPIVAMTYYDPFLGYWTDGKSGRQTASQSQPLVRKVNKQLASAFRARAFEIARVANAFHTYEPLTGKQKTYDHRKVPAPVALICEKTWMCAPAPQGPDVHCNVSGYLKIAKVFEKEKL